jgi:hypothetical protein
MGFFDAPKPKKEKRKSYYLVPTDEPEKIEEADDDEYKEDEY